MGYRFLAIMLAAGMSALPAAAAAAQPAAAPAQRDWTATMAATPEGGFRIGNPDAPVKVVEYLSLTCPHCAAFAREGTPQLISNYVRSGQVSLEYRNFVLNAIDATVSVLARCATPANYFRMSEHLFATQPEWYGRVNGVITAQREQINALPIEQRLARVAELGGLIEMAGDYGITAQQARACLTSEQSMVRISEIAQAAEEMGVQGTPSFLINGSLVNVNSWPEIEILIRQAGG